MRRYYLATHARRPSGLVAAVLLVLGFPSSVGAVCNQKSASTAETDLWNTHQCWQDFFLYSYQAYDQRSSDWAGRGWDDACNVNLEFPKHCRLPPDLRARRRELLLVPRHARLHEYRPIL
jgi:hypothetical protein